MAKHSTVYVHWNPVHPESCEGGRIVKLVQEYCQWDDKTAEVFTICFVGMYCCSSLKLSSMVTFHD